MKKEMPLANKIYFLPIYPDVVRAVRYGSVPCSEILKTLKKVIREHGQENVGAAAKELLDYEYSDGGRGPVYARLKPSIRPFCRQIIGVPPEEEEAFHTNADGSRYQHAPKVPKAAEPVASRAEADQGRSSPAEEARRAADGPDLRAAVAPVDPGARSG